MSLPQALRTLLSATTGVTLPNINYGKRNQFGSFPAIAFEIEDNETITVGSSPIKKCTLRISSVDETGQGAQAIAENVEAALVDGTYNGIMLCPVINKNSVLQAPDTSLGEETNPFICVTTSEIYYKD